MSEEEYRTILEALEQKAVAEGNRIYDERSRESARQLLPVVHFMGTYGLRVGDVLTVRIEGEDRFSYRQKGGEVRQKHLHDESRALLKQVGMARYRPFHEIAKVTLQGALRRFVVELVRRGILRHPYSAHDFRHLFALRIYQETGDVYAVNEALGHATVAVTEVYLSGLGVMDRQDRSVR
jgi:integrase